ncbi:MAG: hypothetical protein ACAI35_05605 [Candidatus Methylacidiphilales bacterium]|nr:hypothetical protein [Candidatus Methylacidiphilales bacterium]
MLNRIQTQMLKLTVLSLTATAQLSLIPVTAARAADSKVVNVVLLQPESSLFEKDPDVKAVSAYITRVKEEFARTILTENLEKTSGFVICAVRTGKKSNAWLDFKPELPPKVANALLTRLKTIPPYAIKKGTMVFAVSFTVNGAAPRSGVPSPKEWSEATTGTTVPVEVEDLVSRVWP